VLIAAGGTGGHLYPGIAIAEELRRRRPGLAIDFACSGTPLEADILGRHALSLLPIRSGGIVGKSIGARLRGGLRAAHGLLQAIGALLRLKPKAVVGVGGYASGPMVMAAVLLRVPTLIHEQNFYPGLTNRLLAPWVRRVAISFEETRRFFKGRGEVTGNPIRAEFAGARRKARSDAFGVLVFGGSQGARPLNNAVVEALPHLREQRLGLRFMHGTGAADLARVMAAYATAGFEATVLPYITAIREAYEQADLVIARAGASSVSEIAACGKASILVPLPRAAHDHQRWNARKMEEAGAAIVLEEAALDGAIMARTILGLRDDPARLLAMEKAATAMARPQAAARIADMVEELIAW
jgi:UDP-N-acetylglucosamine--N-acetylmuramyl-(pentapeptide) pyrophosphoryl-undecaprenol N-acetylglucosamine transferase